MQRLSRTFLTVSIVLCFIAFSLGIVLLSYNYILGKRDLAFEKINMQINDNKEVEIKDGVVNNFKNDIDFYFDTYAGGDEETREFTKYISLYLALIAKRPLHPVGDNPTKDQVFLQNGEYKCKSRIMSIKEKNSMCRYCVCKNAGLAFGF